MGGLTSMDEEQRNSAVDGGFLVNKVNVQVFEAVYVDGCLEIGELIDLGFCRSPVVFFLPVLGQAFDMGQWNAIIKFSSIKLVGKIGGCELLREAFKLAVWNREGERLNSGHCSSIVCQWS